MTMVSTDQAVQLLNSGNVVAMPTETVYGLAARIDSDNGIKKIFSTKHRPFFDPLIVHVESKDMAKSLVADWPVLYNTLTEAFWPGPLTLICKKNHRISPLITAGLDTVALRMPEHPMALALIKKAGPLAAPSANRFGRTSPTTAAHVEVEFAGTVAIVDGGNSKVGLESTVLQAEKKGSTWQVEVLRPGGVSRDMIRKTLTAAGVNFVLSRIQHSAASPGTLKEHYQPTQPVVILDGKKLTEVSVAEINKRLGRGPLRAVTLKLDSQPFQAARTLYDDLRKMSQDTKCLIFVEKLPIHHGEDWEAIWDRLERASSLIIN